MLQNLAEVTLNDFFQVWGIAKPKYNKAIQRALLRSAQLDVGDVDLDAGLRGFEDSDVDEPERPATTSKPPPRPTTARFPRVDTKEVVKGCMLRALAEVTPQMWAACCDHIDRVIMEHHKEVKEAVAQPAHPVVEFDVGLTSDEDEDDDVWETLQEEVVQPPPPPPTSTVVSHRTCTPPQPFRVGDPIVHGTDEC